MRSFLQSIGSLALIVLLTTCASGEKIFEESSGANLEHKSLINELKACDSAQKVARALSGAADKSTNLVDDYTVQKFLDLNELTPGDCNKLALKGRAQFISDLGSEVFPWSYAERNLHKYSLRCLSEAVKRCHLWRSDSLVSVPEAELEILFGFAKFNDATGLTQYLAKDSASPQASHPIRHEEIVYEDPASSSLDERTLLNELDKDVLRPSEVAKLLSQAANKQMVLMDELTVQDFRNLNRATQLDCERASLAKRLKFANNLNGAALKPDIQRQLKAFARGLLMRLIERCYNWHDDPIVKSFATKAELEALKKEADRDDAIGDINLENRLHGGWLNSFNIWSW